MEEFVTHIESHGLHEDPVKSSPLPEIMTQFSSSSAEMAGSLSDVTTSGDEVATPVYDLLPENQLRRTKHRQYYSRFDHVKLGVSISVGMNVLLRPDEEVDDENAWAARVQEIFLIHKMGAKFAGKTIAFPSGLHVSIRWYSRWGDCWMNQYWRALRKEDPGLKRPFAWEVLETSELDVANVMAIIGICRVEYVSAMTSDDWLQVCQQRQSDLDVDSSDVGDCVDDAVSESEKQQAKKEEMDSKEKGKNIFFCYRRLKFSEKGPLIEELDAKPPNMHQFQQLYVAICHVACHA
jgi:hypothetical protein